MLEIKNLVKTYKAKGGVTVTALDHVSLKFPDKGMVFLLGKSGSGKSTLLNVVGGLDRPDDGEIIIKGKNSKTFSAADFDSYRNTFIGFIFQEYNILNEFNVEQNISLALQLQGKPNDKATVNALLAQVDLANFGKRKPNTLSGGQKQRVAIARALIKNPEIIMADEPTGALDSNTGKQVFDTLRKLSQEKLVIVVSHDRDFAEIYGDRIIELSDGKVISDVSKELVDAQPISGNINLINENTIAIKDASKLKKEDMDAIYQVLKKQQGEVILSSGERGVTAVKQAIHINNESSSEIFTNTKEVEVKQYNPADTKFIRSHLPFSRAFKMGSSTLKTKPIRLIFTSFLTIVSLAMFGLTSTLMLFKDNYAVSRAMKNSGRVSEKITKRYEYKTTRYKINNETGEQKKDYSYTSNDKTMISKEDLEQLNNNNQGIKFAGVYEFRNGNVNYPEYSGRTSNGLYYQIERPDGFIEIDDEIAREQDIYVVAGNLPTAYNEVAIPQYFYDLYTENTETLNSYEDVLGTQVELRISSVKYPLTITGVLNVGDMPSKYTALKNNENIADKSQVARDFGDFLEDSYHSSFYVASTFYDGIYYPIFGESNINGYTSSSSIPTTEVRGIVTSHEGAPNYYDRDITRYTSDFITYETVKDVNGITYFDADGKPIPLPVMSDGDAIIPQNMYESMQSKTWESYFRKVNELLDYTEYYDAELKAILDYGTESREEYQNAVETIQLEVYNEGLSYAEAIALHQEEYNKIKNLIDNHYVRTMCTQRTYQIASDYINLFNHSNKPSSDKYNTFVSYYREYTNQNHDTTHMEDVRDFLREDPDGFVKLIRIINWCEYHRYYEFSGEMVNAYYNANGVDDIPDYVIRDAENGIRENDSKYSLNFTLDDITTAVTMSDVYYININHHIGTFNVVGYYVYSKNDYDMIVTTSFLRNNGDLEDYTSYDVQTSKYEPLGKNRYASAIAKTNYSEGQVGILMTKGAGYKYQMDNNTYEMVGSILSLVDVLKTTFLIMGISFGVFAALMLLNFIATSISSKTKEIGILRAVGARGSDLFKIFFSESGLITIICLFFSLIASYLGCYFLNRYMIDQIGIAFLDFGLINMGITIAGAFVIAFLGTFLPVIIAAKKPPVVSIRAL